MAPQDPFFRDICKTQETYKKAKEIFSLAQAKTRQGTGYNLPTTAPLPAICALLASESLNNDDVTEKMAQQVSGTKSSDFKKCYEIVKSALQAERRGRSEHIAFYEDLIRRHKFKIPEDMVLDWILRAERRLPPGNVDIEQFEARYAIFLWVCDCLKASKSDLEKLARKNKLSLKDLKDVYDILDEECLPLRAQIQDERTGKMTSLPINPTILTPITSPKKSPSKKPLRELPQKMSPEKSKPKAPGDQDGLDEKTILIQTLSNRSPEKLIPDTARNKVANQLMPSTSTGPTPQRRTRDLPSKDPPLKRKAAILDPLEDNMTSALRRPPAKIPKLSTHEGPCEPTTTPSRRRQRRSVTPLPLDLGPDDIPDPLFSESDDENDKDIEPARFRPVYIAWKQWRTLDSRVQVMQEIDQKTKASISEHCRRLVGEYRRMQLD